MKGIVQEMERPSSADFEGMVRYELEHKGTDAGTGWFAAVPVGQVDFEDGLEYLRQHPHDEFLHRYMLGKTGAFGPNLTGQLIERGLEREPHLAALMYEACYLNTRFRPLLDKFEGHDLARLADYSPLVYLRWIGRKGDEKRDEWLNLFAENIIRHKPLKPPSELRLAIPYGREAFENWEKNTVSLSKLFQTEDLAGETEKSSRRLSPEETARKAQERLTTIALQKSSENDNPASINPFGLLVKWHMEVTVSSGRNHFRLSGLQTSYGKGLTRQDARASCLMEVCERVSSFASFEGDGTVGYKHGHRLIHGTLEDLRRQGIDAPDPNDMHLEIPYDNQPLYWMPAWRADGLGTRSVHIPSQLVFLFCNLDETRLSDGMPSTGLASGNTMEEAKLSALLEVIERDAERVMPYLPQRCFCLKSQDPLVDKVLEEARQKGLHIRFLNITTELGIPCYKAFIQNPNGDVLKGCAAHLDGKRAAVSSLLEVPFHQSWFRPQPPAEQEKVVRLEDLPNFSTGSAAQDLARLERLLTTNGYHPIYVDLTREDLDIPVVKALIPGLEFFPEFDQFSTLSLRQFGHYWKALGK